MINVVALMGRLAAEPELRHTPSGVAVCSFSLAVDRRFTRQGEQRKADFIDIVAWRQSAEFVCKYFQKGSPMALEGAIQTDTYQDKNGNNRKRFLVVASNISFAGSKPGGGTGGSAAYAQPDVAPEQTAMAGAGQSRTAAPAYATGTIDDFAVISDDEDLPF